jgi:hypothetical protein
MVNGASMKMHKVNPLNEIEFKEVTIQKRPSKMIDSNATIMVPSLWLKVGENGLPTNNLGKTRLKR